jgi:hypothetical protein
MEMARLRPTERRIKAQHIQDRIGEIFLVVATPGSGPWYTP